MRLLTRWIIIGLSLFVAAWVVPGIRVEGDAWVVYAATAAILGLLNAFVKPLLKLLTCSLIILTLGLFSLVINGVVLWLASKIAAQWFHVGFYVDGFWAAFWGALIVSVTSGLLSGMMKEKKEGGGVGQRR
jgi:putative membrane protein